MTLYERYIKMCDELNKCVKQKDWEKYNLLEKEFYKLCEKILEVLMEENSDVLMRLKEG